VFYDNLLPAIKLILDMFADYIARNVLQQTFYGGHDNSFHPKAVLALDNTTFFVGKVRINPMIEVVPDALEKRSVTNTRFATVIAAFSNKF
jgi:hypothetical protein